jgi:predicted metal-dependent HD superfamily phosphohydrolase
MTLSLHRRWLALAGDTPQSIQAGERLIARWSEPHRRYHTLEHLIQVLDGVDELGGHAQDLTAVRFAAWFHDAVYDSSGGNSASEELSARLARAELPPLGVAQQRVAEVARLIRLTSDHVVTADDGNGAVLCDADLAVLGRSPDECRAYARAIRAEYARIPDQPFRAGRAATLRGLLALPALFRTPLARQRYEDQARRNLAAEISALEGADRPG